MNYMNLTFISPASLIFVWLGFFGPLWKALLILVDFLGCLKNPKPVIPIYLLWALWWFKYLQSC